jgi:hypothetical protein
VIFFGLDRWLVSWNFYWKVNCNAYQAKILTTCSSHTTNPHITLLSPPSTVFFLLTRSSPLPTHKTSNSQEQEKLIATCNAENTPKSNKPPFTQIRAPNPLQVLTNLNWFLVQSASVVKHNLVCVLIACHSLLLPIWPEVKL